MKFTRRKDRQRGSVQISGGVYLVRLEDPEEAPLALHFDRPEPGSAMLVANDVMSIQAILVRYHRDLHKYKHGLVDVAELPKLTIDKQKLQPLVDWIRQHLNSITGLVDRVTGEEFKLEDLDREDVDDLLFGLGIDHLTALYGVIKNSDGLDPTMRARLSKYLEVVSLSGGCKCSWCQKGKRDEDCRLKELRPLQDINWMLEQADAFQGASPAEMPTWAVQIHKICKDVAAVKIERAAQAKKNEEIAKKFGLVG